MKSIARIAALALVSTVAAVTTACEGFNIAGGGNCYGDPRTEKRVHEYDTRGRLSRLEIYENGAPSVVFRYEYDRAGRRVEARRYLPTDLRKPVRLERRSLDPEGRLLQANFLAPEGSLTMVVTRDAQGRPVRSEVLYGPASAEVAERSTYNPGELVDPNPLEGAGEDLLQPAPGEVATMWYPIGPTGGSADEYALAMQFPALIWPPERVDITWSDAPAELTRDTDGDGYVDLYAFEVVIATDETREERWDFNGDGVVDGRRLVTFGADGEPVESTSWDETVSPAQVDEHIVYNADETVTTTRGKITRIVYEDGHRVLHTEDVGGDGTIDWRKTYAYDADGRRTGEVRDQDADGSADETWTYTYDDAGRLVQEDMHNVFTEYCAEK
jgi:YD repeat-containing protein